MRVREVSSLGAHKREETSRSMHRSRKERIKTNLPVDASLRTLKNGLVHEGGLRLTSGDFNR
jgi:hypothetical protein